MRCSFQRVRLCGISPEVSPQIPDAKRLVHSRRGEVLAAFVECDLHDRRSMTGQSQQQGPIRSSPDTDDAIGPTSGQKGSFLIKSDSEFIDRVLS